jgi:hypothetical protein
MLGANVGTPKAARQGIGMLEALQRIICQMTQKVLKV